MLKSEWLTVGHGLRRVDQDCLQQRPGRLEALAGGRGSRGVVVTLHEVLPDLSREGSHLRGGHRGAAEPLQTDRQE